MATSTATRKPAKPVKAVDANELPMPSAAELNAPTVESAPVAPLSAEALESIGDALKPSTPVVVPMVVGTAKRALSPKAINVLRFIAANPHCTRPDLVVAFRCGTGWAKLLGAPTKGGLGTTDRADTLQGMGLIEQTLSSGRITATITDKGRALIA